MLAALWREWLDPEFEYQSELGEAFRGVEGTGGAPRRAVRPRARAAQRNARQPGTWCAPANDELALIAPPVYFITLAGVRVPDAGGMVRCPLPDHDDAYASCQVLRRLSGGGGATAARTAGGQQLLRIGRARAGEDYGFRVSHGGELYAVLAAQPARAGLFVSQRLRMPGTGRADNAEREQTSNDGCGPSCPGRSVSRAAPRPGLDDVD